MNASTNSETTNNNNNISAIMKRNKQAILNKFLSKTNHMIDRCDPTIASWSSDGDCFVIKDVDEFSSKVLPLYFKHSKFPSFVRQLNFYGFHKLRSDPDFLERDSKQVRFGHEYFKKGQPNLLYKIQRSTRTSCAGGGEGCDASSSNSHNCSPEQVESLRYEIKQMNQQLEKLSTLVDIKIAAFQSAVEADYQRRMLNIERSYKALSEMSASLVGAATPRRSSSVYVGGVTTATPTASSTVLPELTPEIMNGSSLLTLSGIASLVSGAAAGGGGGGVGGVAAGTSRGISEGEVIRRPLTP